MEKNLSLTIILFQGNVKVLVLFFSHIFDLSIEIKTIQNCSNGRRARFKCKSTIIEMVNAH